jgi:Rad3-related DNA helicase
MYNSFSIYIDGYLKDKRKSNVLIIDEAHSFEDTYTSYVSCKINARLMKKYGFENSEIEKLDKIISKIKDVEGFKNFVEFTFLDKIKALKINFADKLKNPSTSNDKKKTLTKFSLFIDGEISKFERMLNEFKRTKEPDEDVDPKDNWVLDVEKNSTEKTYSGIELNLQPVWAYPYLKKAIWNLYDHIILMSGTILNKEIFSFINGIESDLSAYLEVDNPFPLKNRPIYYIKAGKMTYDKKVETFKKQKLIIQKVLNRHPDDKGIVHTTNYEIANWIRNEVINERLMFHDSTDKDKILKSFLSDITNKVIVSPSMTTGVSLDDDNSRLQLMLKIPYPNLGSNKVKQRLKTYKHWYNYQTVSELVQAYGRSIRSYEDYAITYILDESFSDLLVYNNLLPKSFIDAVKIIKLNE